MTVELDELLSDKEIMPSLAAAPKLAIGKPTKSHHTAKKSVSPTEKKPAGGKEVPTPPSPRRRSTGELLGEVIEKLAVLIGSVNPPGARALMFASPALGSSIDSVVAGSPIDKRILQPLTVGAEKWATLASALGLPMMVAAVSLQPELRVVLEPQMRAAMVVCLDERVKVLKKHRKKEQDVAKTLADLVEMDPQFAESKDPIGDLLAGFFQSPPAPEEAPVGAAV